MRAVFYSNKWKNKIVKSDYESSFEIEQVGDKSELKSIIKVLKEKNISEIFIFDECEVFNPGITEEYFIITDHINATGDNPLIGQNDEKAGVRFPDMTFPYSDKLNNELKSILDQSKIEYKETVLFGSTEKPKDNDTIQKLVKLNCHISNFNIMWLNILARHAGIEVGAVVMKKK